ncbi:MAG: hypothetical protein RR595_02945 [Lysinibacillus sp.]
MKKKRFKFVIPVMVIVTMSAIFMLERFYPEVPGTDRIFITIGATLISGVIAYFLFPQQGEEEIDDRGPY